MRIFLYESYIRSLRRGSKRLWLASARQRQHVQRFDDARCIDIHEFSNCHKSTVSDSLGASPRIRSTGENNNFRDFIDLGMPCPCLCRWSEIDSRKRAQGAGRGSKMTSTSRHAAGKLPYWKSNVHRTTEVV